MRSFVAEDAFDEVRWDRLFRGTRRQRRAVYQPGETIIEDQDKVDRLYYLEDGEVGVEKAGMHVATIVAGRIFGEFAYLDLKSHIASSSGITNTARRLYACAMLGVLSVCRVQVLNANATTNADCDY